MVATPHHDRARLWASNLGVRPSAFGTTSTLGAEMCDDPLRPPNRGTRGSLIAHRDLDRALWKCTPKACPSRLLTPP